MKIFKNLYKHLFGELIYTVSVMSIYGEETWYEIKDLKIIDKEVEKLNADSEYHHMIRKIEKKRVYPFKYNKLIKHKRLTFQKEGLTELVYNEKYDRKSSFLITDKSLTNVKRVNYK
jgi:hypothetical protein